MISHSIGSLSAFLALVPAAAAQDVPARIQSDVLVRPTTTRS
jgi:hypothetical protein